MPTVSFLLPKHHPLATSTPVPSPPPRIIPLPGVSLECPIEPHIFTQPSWTSHQVDTSLCSGTQVSHSSLPCPHLLTQTAQEVFPPPATRTRSDCNKLWPEAAECDRQPGHLWSVFAQGIQRLARQYDQVMSAKAYINSIPSSLPLREEASPFDEDSQASIAHLGFEVCYVPQEPGERACAILCSCILYPQQESYNPNTLDAFSQWTSSRPSSIIPI